MQKLSFKSKIFIGFSAVFIFAMCAVIIILMQFNSINKSMKEVYEHPYKVSNAIRDVEIDVYRIARLYRVMKDAEGEKAVDSLLALEKKSNSSIFKKIEIIRNLYLGNSKDVDSLVAHYSDWQKTRVKMHQLKMENNISGMLDLLNSDSRYQLDEIIRHANAISDYASNKGASLIHQAEAEKERATRNLIIILVGVFFIIGIISILISRSITKPIRNFVNAANTIFFGNIENSYPKYRDESELLDYTLNELERAYQNVERQNEEIKQSNLKILNFNLELEDKIQAQLKETKENDALFRGTFESSAIGMTIVSPEGHFLQVNPFFCSILGYDEAELLQKTFHGITHPDDLQADLILFEKAVRGEISEYKLEKRFLHKNKSTVWTQISASLLRNDKNEPLYFIKQVENINERKYAQEALQNIERKQETMLQTLVEGLVAVDITGQITYSNAAACEILEIEKDILGKYYQSQEWLQKDAQGNPYPPEQLPLAIALTEQRKVEGIEHQIVSPIGQWKWLSVNAAPLFNDEGVLFGAIASFSDITERKQAENELKKSEKKLKLAQRAAHIGNWDWDVKSECVEWSDEMFRIFNIDKNAIEGRLGDAIAKVIHPDDLALVQKSNAMTFADQKPIEYRIINPDQSIRFILAETGEVTKDKNGNITTLSGTCQDITERKMHELALQKSETRYRGVLTNLEAAIVVHAPDTSIQYSNRRASELLGLSEDQMQGKQAFDSEWKFLDENAVPLTQTNFPVNRILTSQKSLRNMVLGINRPATNDVAWVAVDGFPVFNDEGILEEILISFIDITENRLVAEKLRESEEKLKTLFDSMTEMVVMHELVFNENGEPINYRILDCNNAFAKVTGIKRSDAIGKMATELYETENPPYFDEYSRVALTGVPTEMKDYFEPMDKFFLISVVSPNKNQFATITTDITLAQKTQEVINAKNKALENYIYVASHDLRTPLVNIQGFSQRLQKQTSKVKEIVAECQLEEEVRENLNAITNEGIAKTLNFIFSNVTKMETLISGLLQISRTGRVKMFVKKIDINQLIKVILGSLNFQITENAIQIVVSDLPYCYGDENQINQLFTNIIGNAIKYRDKSRPLTIEITGHSQYNKAIYRVKDTGIGIAPRYLEKIWEVFYQVNPATAEPGEGIGLSLAKTIVDKHRGKIWAESEENVGTVFTIELPRTEFEEI